VAIVAGSAGATPLYGSLLSTHLLITVALLVLAWISDWQSLALIAAVMTAFATMLARASSPGRFFAFGAALYALIVAYPLILGNRARKQIEPYLAAVLASGWFFFVARDAMKQAHLGYMIGVLPVGEAIVLLVVLWRLLTIERPDDRFLSRLALVAGAALAFITAAIPLQLEKQWITIAWALEGAALVWLFRRIPHRGLLLWAAALLAAVFMRLTLNPAVLTYHPLGNHSIFNWYLYTYVVAAAAMFVAAWYARELGQSSGAILNSAGTILLFLVLNIEIADFYSHGRTLTFNFFSSSLAQDLTYTIGWALFAIAMLIAGIVVASRATRIAATALFLVTILKCFLHDLARLGGLYRVASLLGLAASLVVVAVLLQKFVMLKPKEGTP